MAGAPKKFFLLKTERGRQMSDGKNISPGIG
jgi:hypothetical protein